MRDAPRGLREERAPAREFGDARGAKFWFVGEIIRGAGERVDIADILAQIFWHQPRRHRKIFVMTVGDTAGECECGGEIGIGHDAAIMRAARGRKRRAQMGARAREKFSDI